MNASVISPLAALAGTADGGHMEGVADRERIRRAVDDPIRPRESAQQFDVGSEVPARRHRLDLDLVVGADRGSQKQARFPCVASAERQHSGARPM
jgi:hypothetical protein